MSRLAEDVFRLDLLDRGVAVDFTRDEVQVLVMMMEDWLADDDDE